MTAPSFERFGDVTPVSPVVLSVVHAGRDYPLSLRSALRVPLLALRPLEDRLVDLVAIAARQQETLFVARRARAWIDLNRGERERDPRIDDGARATAIPFQSAKVRGGLGLIPRRVNGAGDLWSRRLSADEVTARIAADHRPYHAAVGAALAAAHARYGIALLLDIHSMPAIDTGDAPRIVVGDRFGRSAGARFVSRIEGVARQRGVLCALNSPYAGGHILDRHGAPARGVHAIQLEIDRSLYLDPTLTEVGDGFAATAASLRAIVDALTDEAQPAAIAAE